MAEMSLDQIIKKDNPKRIKGGFHSYKPAPSKHGIKKQYRELHSKKFTNKTLNLSWFKPTKVIVNNLDFRVTDMELKELYEEFGPIQKVQMHYNEFRRPTGSANILFERRDDAERAVRQYNGVPLDGRPMEVSIVQERQQEFKMRGRRHFSNHRRFPTQSHHHQRDAEERQFTSGGHHNFANHSKQSQHKDNRNRPQNKRQNKNYKRKPTLEELDAEMDEYNKARISKSADSME